MKRGSATALSPQGTGLPSVTKTKQQDAENADVQAIRRELAVQAANFAKARQIGSEGFRELIEALGLDDIIEGRKKK